MQLLTIAYPRLRARVDEMGGQGVTVLDKAPYKTAYKLRVHPLSYWITNCIPNFIWVLDYLEALMDEYTFRFGEIHKTSLRIPAEYRRLAQHIELIAQATAGRTWPITRLTIPPVLVDFDKYVVVEDPAEPRLDNLPRLDDLETSHQIMDYQRFSGSWGDATDAYRDYYSTSKAHLGKWTNREIPTWFKNHPNQSGKTEIITTRKVKGRVLVTRTMK